jgi:hypothetical protein
VRATYVDLNASLSGSYIRKRKRRGPVLGRMVNGVPSDAPTFVKQQSDLEAMLGVVRRPGLEPGTC